MSSQLFIEHDGTSPGFEFHNYRLMTIIIIHSPTSHTAVLCILFSCANTHTFVPTSSNFTAMVTLSSAHLAAGRQHIFYQSLSTSSGSPLFNPDNIFDSPGVSEPNNNNLYNHRYLLTLKIAMF